MVEVLASADAAMYRAKETPGNTCEVFSTSWPRGPDRLHLEAGLLDGLARDELVLHYQPVVDVPTGRIVGAEALRALEPPGAGLPAAGPLRARGRAVRPHRHDRREGHLRRLQGAPALA